MRLDSGLSSEGEIISARHQFYTSSEPAVQTEAIDTLAAYGEQAIESITEVISLSDITDHVRKYGLQAIEEINRHN